MRKVLGSLVILAFLAIPVQGVMAETELQKTQKMLTSCNAMLGNAMAKIMGNMPKLSPAKQKQVSKRVETLESEIKSLEKWISEEIKEY